MSDTMSKLPPELEKLLGGMLPDDGELDEEFESMEALVKALCERMDGEPHPERMHAQPIESPLGEPVLMIMQPDRMPQRCVTVTYDPKAHAFKVVVMLTTQDDLGTMDAEGVIEKVFDGKAPKVPYGKLIAA